LPYDVARFVWVAIGIAAVVLSPLLLHQVAPHLPRRAAVVLALLFVPDLRAVSSGQTTPLVLLLAAAAWRLLSSRRDRGAVVALAWLTIKPQLTGLLVFGVLLWAIRRRRWRVVGTFALALGALMTASTALVPSWHVAMIRSIRDSPLPTDAAPWTGVTVPLLLQCLGLSGRPLALARIALAAVALGGVASWAWDRRRGAVDVMGLSLLAAFVASPYAQTYDLAILLFPSLVLLGDRPAAALQAIMLLLLLALPHLNLWAIGARDWPILSQIWIPALLAVLWWRRPEAGKGPNRGSET
jgi:hypothetical protein